MLLQIKAAGFPRAHPTYTYRASLDRRFRNIINPIRGYVYPESGMIECAQLRQVISLSEALLQLESVTCRGLYIMDRACTRPGVVYVVVKASLQIYVFFDPHCLLYFTTASTRRSRIPFYTLLDFSYLEIRCGSWTHRGVERYRRRRWRRKARTGLHHWRQGWRMACRWRSWVCRWGCN